MGRPRKYVPSDVDPKPTDTEALKGKPYRLLDNMTTLYALWRMSSVYGKLSYSAWLAAGRPA